MANTKVTGDLIAGGTITTFNLADGSVTAAKLNSITTDSISEGTNLFYTDARVETYLSGNGYDTATNIIAAITDSAPATLDTLNELAAALGDDPNFATTVTNSIATKWTQDNTKISNWDTAYSWGDHATVGYLTSVPAPLDKFSTSAWAGGGAYDGYVFAGGNTRFGFSSTTGVVDLYIDGNFYATDSSHLVWHAGNDGAGSGLDADTLDGLQASAFLTAEADTLATVTARGSSTTGAITVNGTLNIPNDGLISVNNEPDVWGARFRTSTSTTNLGTQIKNIIWTGGGTSEGFAVSGNGTGGAALEVRNDGIVWAKDSFRAPIFYDSNNTGYYVDPSGTSIFNDASFGLGSGNSNQGIQISYGNYSDGYGRIRFYQDGSNHQTIHSFSNSWAGGTLQSSSSGAINIYGYNGVTFGLWNDVSGWIDNAGTLQTKQSLRAPIFYDSNDTNTYFDSNRLVIRGGDPTIILRDTNQRSAMLHCNANRFYVLSGVADSVTWTQVNGQWPAYWQLDTNQLFGGGAASFVGDVTANTSDRRLKENIKNIPDAIDKVKSLNGVTFDWKDNLEEIHYTRQRIHDVGVIAQEVQAVLPDAVRPAPFDTDEEGNSRSGENYLTVQYEKIVPLLIEAVKELSNKVEELENKLNGTD